MSPTSPKIALVRLANQYGQQVIIPLDEEALAFAEIAGTRTLTASTIKLMKKLGYAIQVEQTLPTVL